jgi:hypothetical protein
MRSTITLQSRCCCHCQKGSKSHCFVWRPLNQLSLVLVLSEKPKLPLFGIDDFVILRMDPQRTTISLSLGLLLGLHVSGYSWGYLLINVVI